MDYLATQVLNNSDGSQETAASGGYIFNYYAAITGLNRANDQAFLAVVLGFLTNEETSNLLGLGHYTKVCVAAPKLPSFESHSMKDSANNRIGTDAWPPDGLAIHALQYITDGFCDKAYILRERQIAQVEIEVRLLPTGQREFAKLQGTFFDGGD